MVSGAGTVYLEHLAKFKSPINHFLSFLGPISLKRSYFESRRWILNSVRPRISSIDSKNVRIHEALAAVLIETSQNQGKVIAQRNEHHKTCENNRAYAHFR